MVLLLAVVLFLGPHVIAAVYTVDRGSDLQAAINYAADGDTLIIGNKDFQAKATEFVDPLCGNCLDPSTEVKASYGFVVKGKALVLIGNKRSRLITNAGYGLYFENSNGSVVKNLTITGGRRDSDGNATDAAIVVRRSRVTIENVRILDNDNRSDDTTVIVGIGGIFGREGAELTISGCSIMNNGWDGIALYRGASANISDCLIKDGRGAGIGVTWDACVMAYRNKISGYWKGIGAFGTAWVIAHNNLVHDNLGWGIVATGKSYMDIANNVVHHNGNCGVAPWSTESRGRIVNNIITENGWRDKWVCPCVGVWNYGDWAKWEFAHNIVWNNKAGNYEDIWDQSGLNGNQDIDPLFVGEGNYRLQKDSPAVNAGDSAIYNPDGSVSHLGIYGGPQAWGQSSGNR
ncbi:MAG: right-handed parallel beta-helix repeat-containing protein [Candidatus Zixiibacteriota bacterium]